MVPGYACVISRLRERMLLMAAWGLPAAIRLDIAAHRDNTPGGYHSNTNRPMEGVEQRPVLRVAHRLGWMARRRRAGSHRGRHKHRVSNMAPNTAPRTVRSRWRSVGLPSRGSRGRHANPRHANRPRDLPTHAHRPTCARSLRLPRAAPPV
jgi:hypothetical protein